LFSDHPKGIEFEMLRRTQSTESIICRSERNDNENTIVSSKKSKARLNDLDPSKTYGNDFRGRNQEDSDDSNSSCTCPPGPGQGNCHTCRTSHSNGTGPRYRQRQMSITVVDSGEHCHDDELQKCIDNKARKKLWMASALCVVFMIAEAVGGIMAGSLAVATDAAHLLTDFAGFMISLFALYMSSRPATKSLPFGYHRAEVIGALTSVLLIWVVTGILVYMAVQRIVSKDFEIDAPIMLITSGVGLVVNIIMGCTLHQHAHTHGGGSSHGHGHSHGGGSKQGPSGPHSHANGKSSVPDDVEHGNSHSSGESTSENISVVKPNINVRAAFIHVLGDFIQSVGVFAAAIVIYFKPDLVIVDPICTFLFSILVLATTYAIVKDTLNVLMEGIPKGIDFNDVRATLLQVKGVFKVHNLRIWSLSMDRIALSAHLAVDPNSTVNSNEILRKSSQVMKNKYGFSEVTIQIEDFSERMQDCSKCLELNN